MRHTIGSKCMVVLETLIVTLSKDFSIRPKKSATAMAKAKLKVID